MLSHFSRVLATLWTVALPAPWSMGILQARILEWMVISSSRGCSRSRDRTHLSYISCIGRQVLYHWHHWGSPMRERCCLKRLADISFLHITSKGAEALEEGWHPRSHGRGSSIYDGGLQLPGTTFPARSWRQGERTSWPRISWGSPKCQVRVSGEGFWVLGGE